MVIKSTTWRQNEDMLREFFHLDAADVVRYVGKNFDPDDVFEAEDLAQWAIDNGYVLADKE